MFILANAYNDFWFHQLDLIMEPEQIAFSVYKFYSSFPLLKTVEDFIYHHQPHNLTFLTYAKSPMKDEGKLSTKLFRRQYIGNDFQHLKFCIVEDENLATLLGIDTSNEGEIYMYSNYPTSPNMKVINLDGVQFYSKKIVDKQAALGLDDSSFFKEMLSYPIVIRTFSDYLQFSMKFKVGVLNRKNH